MHDTGNHHAGARRIEKLPLPQDVEADLPLQPDNRAALMRVSLAREKAVRETNDTAPLETATFDELEQQIAPLASFPPGTDDPADQEAHAGEWHEVNIRSGDTLSAIFNRLEIYSVLHPIMELGEATEILDTIQPGRTLRVRIGEGFFEELVYEPNSYERLHVEKTSDGLQAEMREQEIEIRHAEAQGVIHHSLFLSGQKAGLSDAMIMEMAGIFGWDIDFVLDIRAGDLFTVIYEEHYRDGEKIGTGDIVAAEFVNRGETYQALQYTNEDGRTDYYAPDGRSMRKPFMRNPVDFNRISSHFDPNRRHPVLNTTRAHNGTDYAAPTGTPIKASGDGKVVHRGWKGGYGKAIILRHGSKYSTLYGHMSRFASNTNVGQRVEQGQVIGYVGSTGMSTGPHLHYEFRVNGVHRDPLKVELPAADPLPESEMEAFTAAVAPYLEKLENATSSTLVAADQEQDQREKLSRN